MPSVAPLPYCWCDAARVDAIAFDRPLGGRLGASNQIHAVAQRHSRKRFCCTRAYLRAGSGRKNPRFRLGHPVMDRHSIGNFSAFPPRAQPQDPLRLLRQRRLREWAKVAGADRFGQAARDIGTSVSTGRIWKTASAFPRAVRGPAISIHLRHTYSSGAT